MGNKVLKAINKDGRRSDLLFYSTIPLILRYEGGFVNDPVDRGGKTNMGVTQGFLEKYRKKAGVNARNVEELTRDEAIRLYKAEWDTYGFGVLDNTDIMKLVYDFSVNSGPKTAIRYLQKTLNVKGCNIIVDGYIGVQTNRAVNAVDEKWLKRELQASRAEHCDSIVDRNPEQKRFVKGWFNRINDIGNRCGCDEVFRSRHLK